MANVKPLLELIKSAESKGAVASQGVPSEYDVVWGGISPRDRPQNRVGKYVTQMTIKEVLDWQDSIDPFYNSEATGAYQMMEDTLRGIVHDSELNKFFDSEMQDYICFDRLLKMRGLDKWEKGKISDIDFGNNISWEWASFPIMNGPDKGKARYGNDKAGNPVWAFKTPEQVLKVLEECRGGTAKLTPPSVELQNPENGATEVDYIVDRLNRIEAKIDKLMTIYCWDCKG